MAQMSKKERATEQRLIDEETAGWWDGLRQYVKEMIQIGKPLFWGNGKREER